MPDQDFGIGSILRRLSNIEKQIERFNLRSSLDGTGVSTHIPFWTGSKTLSNNSELIWDNVNKRVGIGDEVTSPTARLEVSHYPWANVEPNILLDQPSLTWASVALFNAYRYLKTASSATDGNFREVHIGAGGVTVGYTAPPVYGSSDAMYINGNVGIGTSSPGYKLDVAGDINSSSGYIRQGGTQLYVDFATYTPVWSVVGGGTPPDIGNGTLYGKYCVNGKLVTASIYLLAGSTTTFGVGKWRFTLPITASQSIHEIGSAIASDTSSTFGYASVVQITNATTPSLINVVGYGTTGYDSAIPFAWANTDRITITIAYQTT